MRHLVRFVLLSVLLLAVGLGGLAWRLAQGPLSLAVIEAPLLALVARSSPFQVSFTAPALAWSPERRTLAVAVEALEVRTQAGRLVMSAPRARAVVDAEALLFERIVVPIEIALDLPAIELTRTAPRHFQLGFAGQLAALPFEHLAGGNTLADLLGGAPEAGDPRLRHLERVQVQAPVLRFVDDVTGRRLAAEAAELTATRHARGWQGSLAADLDPGPGKGLVSVAAEPGATEGEQQVEVSLSGLPIRSLGDLLPSLSPDALRGRIFGHAGFSLDTARLEPGPARFAFSAISARLDLPATFAAPILLDRAALTGELAAGWRQATIGRARFESGKLKLGGRGTVSLHPGAVEASARLKAEGLDAGEVVRFWPLHRAPAARRWVAERIAGGNVAAGEVRLTVPLPGRAEAGSQPALDLAFDFTEATVRYFGAMPPAEAVAGSARITWNDLAFTIRQARVDEVAVEQGTVVIDRLRVPGTPPALRTELSLAGPLRSALAVLDAEPLRLAQKMKLRPAQVSGQGRGRFALQLPLHRDTKAKDVDYRFEGRLTKAGIEAVHRDLSARNGELALAADPKAVTAAGNLALEGVPFAIDWRENLDPAAALRRRVAVKGSLDAEQAPALDVAWPTALAGSVGIDATVQQPRRGARQIDFDLDLTPTAIDLPGRPLDKPAGVAGRAVGSLTQPTAEAVSIDRVEVTLPTAQLEAAIEARLAPFAWRRLDIRRLRAAGSELQAALIRRDDALVTGSITAARLDLRPWRGGGAAGDPGQASSFDLRLEAQEVHLAEVPVRAVSGHLVRNAEVWSLIELKGALADGSPFVFDHAADRDGGGAALRAENGGALLEALGFPGAGLQGGRVRANATVTGPPSDRTVAGELRWREFAIMNSPIAARIFTLASFQGLASALTGGGIPVQRLTVPFTWRGERIEIRQARLLGSEIGARADGSIDLGQRRIDLAGTVAPAYTINWILGRIPIVGQILRGERADAALAATFSVKGALASPEIVVNPLAALVPGMIRDLFRDFGTMPGDENGDADDRR